MAQKFNRCIWTLTGKGCHIITHLRKKADFPKKKNRFQWYQCIWTLMSRCFANSFPGAASFHYLRVRDCCECFVFRNTHWRAYCIMNEKFSILHEAKLSAVLKISTSLHSKQAILLISVQESLMWCFLEK